MSLRCVDRTAVIQHVFSLTLLRYHSSTPPTNASSRSKAPVRNLVSSSAAASYSQFSEISSGVPESQEGLLLQLYPTRNKRPKALQILDDGGSLRSQHIEGSHQLELLQAQLTKHRGRLKRQSAHAPTVHELNDASHSPLSPPDSPLVPKSLSGLREDARSEQHRTSISSQSIQTSSFPSNTILHPHRNPSPDRQSPDRAEVYGPVVQLSVPRKAADISTSTAGPLSGTGPGSSVRHRLGRSPPTEVKAAAATQSPEGTEAEQIHLHSAKESTVIRQFKPPSIQYARKGLETKVAKYLKSISPLPTDAPALRDLSHELRQIISALTDDKTPGIWRLRDSYFHNSIRALSKVHLDVLTMITDLSPGFLQSPSVAKSFTSLLYSLSLRPPLHSTVIPKHWRNLQLSNIVVELMSIGIRLDASQFAIITNHTAQHDHIHKFGPPPVDTWIGEPGAVEHNLQEISRIWKTRRRLLAFVRQEPSFEKYDHDITAEIITTSLKEATVLGIENISRDPDMRQQLSEWIKVRDGLFPTWTARLDEQSKPLLDLNAHDWHGIASMLRLMLHHTVLASRCRPQPPKALESGDGGAKIPSQGQLLQKLIQHTAKDESEEFKPNGAYLHGAIFTLRNEYYRNYQFKDLVALVRLLVDCGENCPELDGRLFRSLITATRDTWQFKTMLVMLDRLKPPSTPVILERSIFRQLCHYAVLLDARREPGHMIGDLNLRIGDELVDIDSETAHKVRTTGWKGLWRTTLEKWHHGMSPIQHSRLTKARERGEVDSAFTRNAEKRRKRAAWFQMKKSLNNDGTGYGGAVLAERPAFRERKTQRSVEDPTNST